MEDIEYAKLSGSWFLHRTDEPFVPELLPVCHHGKLDVKEDGTFSASEEVRMQGKVWMSDDISGSFKNGSIEANMFDDKIGLMMELIDTDYEKYIIGYECYDNMQFALETEDVEPVHIITMGIATRNPDEDEEFLASLEKIALEKLPFMKQEDFAEVKQGKKGKCDY